MLKPLAGVTMKKIIILALCLLLPATTIMAANKVEKKSEVKTLSGMSIIGNDEAPKALHIVPWKSSEIIVELDLIRIDDPENAPVDRDVFIRQIDFYEASTAHQTERN
jgi:hypothetical protein